MRDFHAQLAKAREQIVSHLGKNMVLNGIAIKAPLVTEQAGAGMAGYRRQALDEKVLLLTEAQAVGITKGMTLEDGDRVYTLVEDPVPRKDHFLACSLREISA